MNVMLLLFAWLSIVGITHSHKTLPEDISYKSPLYSIPEKDIDFLYDLTYEDSTGQNINHQEIFTQAFSIINNANDFIILDMFLYNDYANSGTEIYRQIADELTEKLLKKQIENPGIDITIITDPINSCYGGCQSDQLEKLELAGISVITSDLRKLRDSNPLYSSFWRTFIQWFGNNDRGGIFRHPFSNSESKVTLRSYLNLVNFKANHRKLIVADNKDSFSLLVMSANPHDGSSAHSNVAFCINGDLGIDAYRSEAAVTEFSDISINREVSQKDPKLTEDKSANISVQLLTEHSIKEELINQLSSLAKDDEVDIAMFYLSDRDIIKCLLKAMNRGTKLRLILDPNKDAFGYEKNGIPNRQVAHELSGVLSEGSQIRWYDTSGEQFHTKMIIINRMTGISNIFLGSANLTRRNLDDFNLETDVRIQALSDSDIITEINDYFHTIWSNEDNMQYTVDYEIYSDSSRWKTFIYRFQEFTGLCTY